MATKKNGPLTQEEKEFIRMNADSMDAIEIGNHLSRNPTTVRNFINSMDMSGDSGDILNLRKREDWNMIKGQFSDEEIVLFEWHWNKMVQQFQEELKHSESLQVLSGIRHEILGNRALTDQRRIMLQVNETEAKLQKERDKATPDYAKIDSLEKLAANLAQVLDLNNKEYRECNDKLTKVIKDLKASREQRLARTEESSKSIAVLIRRLLEDRSLQKSFGDYGAKMRLAMEGEYWRLGSVMKYADGMYDRPLLNTDTLKIESDIEEL